MSELYLEQVLGECRRSREPWEITVGRIHRRLSDDPEASFFRQQGSEALADAMELALAVGKGYDKTGVPGPSPEWMVLKALCNRFGLDYSRLQ